MLFRSQKVGGDKLTGDARALGAYFGCCCSVTGYEQVRSIAADLAGDREAAERVELELPETGVCTRGGVEGGPADSGCRGGPVPAGVEACCAQDADAKAVGKTGCGCS